MRLVALLLACVATAATATDIAWKDAKGSISATIEQERVAYRFIFTNDSAQPIRVTAVRPTCGCLTAGPVGQEPVLPSQSGGIDLEFDPGLSAGVSRKHIDVDFVRSDGSAFTETVSLECRVDSPLVVRKRAVFWDRDETRDDKTIDITVEAAHDIHLLEATSDNEAYVVRLEQPGPKAWRIVVSPKQLGVTRATITVRTDATTPRLQRIALYAFGL